MSVESLSARPKHEPFPIGLSRSRECRNSEQFSERVKVCDREYDSAARSKTLTKMGNVREEREMICREIKD